MLAQTILVECFVLCTNNSFIDLQQLGNSPNYRHREISHHPGIK